MPSGAQDDRIQHIFVLMMENRSFDHMLGYADLAGKTPAGQPTRLNNILNIPATFDIANTYNGTRYPTTKQAPQYITDSKDGPGHEFEDVAVQLSGVASYKKSFSQPPLKPYPALAPIGQTGFITSYEQNGSINPPGIMDCFDTPAKLPVLLALAQNFAVCDAWHCSLPGPTWPNRLFIHAATSGGLYRSPSTPQLLNRMFLDGFDFDNGTIYDKLDKAGKNWMVFHGDDNPQVFSLKGMDLDTQKKHCFPFSQFAAKLNDPAFDAAYVFIEPNYGNVMYHSICGNSQHAVDDVARGEQLIKEVYETLVGVTRVWNNSLLLLTWDEHGGFFDHVTPPAAMPPGDTPKYADDPKNGFDFTRLGLRVPAVVISPYVQAGTIDHTTYDHTSLLKTMENLYGLTPLTKRDANAASFEGLLTLSKARGDMPKQLPDPAPSTFDKCPGDFGMSPAELATDPEYTAPVSSAMRGILQTTMMRDLQTAPSDIWDQIQTTVAAIQTQGQAKQYLQAARQRMMDS